MITAGTHYEEANTTKGRMRMYAQKLIARKILAAKKAHHSALATMPPLDEQEVLTASRATKMSPTQL